MKLVQAREWVEAYRNTDRFINDALDLETIMLDAFTAGWREGWEDGELCGYNRGREYCETDLEIVRNAGIQEGIERGRELERMREYPVICPQCGLSNGQHKMDCSNGR